MEVLLASMEEDDYGALEIMLENARSHGSHKMVVSGYILWMTKHSDEIFVVDVWRDEDDLLGIFYIFDEGDEMKILEDTGRSF